MPAATSFVGRVTELDALQDALTAAEGGRAQAVQVVGPAGIGKSRLLRELAARADARGHVVLTGTGAELEQDLPFWLFVDALDEYAESLEPHRLARLSPAVRADLATLLPAFADAGADEQAAPALHERHRAHRAIRELLEHLAATRPMVLMLDDVHWADPASIDLLVALLHRPPSAGVLLVLAARPQQLAPRLASALVRAHREGALARLGLDELSREEAAELLGADAGALYEEAGGNPFYLEQLARAPGASRPLSAGAGVDLAGLQVPPMVAAALNEELAELPPAARAALDGAAVAGDPFELDLAGPAADLAEPQLLDALDELIRRELVLPTDAPRRFRFRHPIVRRAVYEATANGWRIAAHLRAAAALAAAGADASSRAHHVERSARAGDADAIAVLRQAGDESAFKAPATAARWYLAALRLLPPSAAGEERIALLVPAARALMATGQFAAAHERLLEALALAPADSVALRTELAAPTARVEHFLGQHEQAHERLVRALDELADEGSPEGVALTIELTTDGLHRMNYGSMTEWGRRAAAAADRVGDPVLQAAALAAAARGAAVAGATPEAAERCREAARRIDALSDDELARRLDALTHLAGAEFYLHRLDAAEAHGERLIAIGRATGQDQQFPVLFAMLGIVWLLRGRLLDVVEDLDDAVDAARLTGNAQTLAWTLYARGQHALTGGDVALALSATQEAVDLVDDGRPGHALALAAFGLAEANLAVGRPDRAVEVLERTAGGPDLPLHSTSFRSYCLEALVRARIALGDRDAAARAVTAAVAAADAVGLPLARAWADRAGAAVALDAGEAARAAELALRSTDDAETAGAPIQAAISRTVAGPALAAAGDGDRARAELERAVAELDARGAARYREAAERELRRLGHRIQRRPAGGGAKAETGVASLTKRELEIARCIVDRQTNRQIAETLFLSPKTVETHIRNIFAKLDAASRVDVARIVEQADRQAAS